MFTLWPPAHHMFFDCLWYVLCQSGIESMPARVSGCLTFVAGRFFLKEGVVHAMEQLAATAPKDEPKGEPKDAASKGRTPPARRSSSRLKVCPRQSFLLSSLSSR